MASRDKRSLQYTLFHETQSLVVLNSLNMVFSALRCKAGFLRFCTIGFEI